jgi:hypothetical protein
MASKRSAGSILDFFSKKSKAQTSSLLTEEIPLVDFTDSSTTSRDESAQIFTTNQKAPSAETPNSSNFNDVSEHDLEHENQNETFSSSNLSLNSDNSI